MAYWPPIIQIYKEFIYINEMESFITEKNHCKDFADYTLLGFYLILLACN